MSDENILDFLVQTNELEPVIPELTLGLPIVFFDDETCVIHDTDRYKRIGWCMN